MYVCMYIYIYIYIYIHIYCYCYYCCYYYYCYCYYYRPWAPRRSRHVVSSAAPFYVFLIHCILLHSKCLFLVLTYFVFILCLLILYVYLFDVHFFSLCLFISKLLCLRFMFISWTPWAPLRGSSRKTNPRTITSVVS